MNKKFDIICNFVKELSDIYSKNKSLALYNRLLSKTLPMYTDAVKKHLNIFKEYVFKNKEFILNKDEEKLENLITYNERIYINIGHLIKISDNDTKNSIWKHLSLILSMFDEDAKEIVMNENKENNFIKDMVNILEKNVDVNDKKVLENPMNTIGELMNKGVFNDLMKKVQTGDIDIGKLMSRAQEMALETLNEDEEDEEKSDMDKYKTDLPDISMLTGMMGGNNLMDMMKNLNIDLNMLKKK